MAEAGMFAPDDQTLAYWLNTLPERRATPTMVSGLAGPDNAGPEQAGALSFVFGSFASSESAQIGFRTFADAQCSVRDAPGFLRWISFNDGPHGYGLGWWRSAEDAANWARGEAHRGFVAAQRKAPFELSQFAGIWTAHTLGGRNFYCPQCRQRSDASATACDCGEPLNDGFAPSPQVVGI